MGDCDPALDDLSCCSDDSQCGLGEGDCDSDSHCAGDLTCGNDNCPSPAASYMDCCEGKLVLKFNSKDKIKHLCNYVLMSPSYVKYFKQSPKANNS